MSGDREVTVVSYAIGSYGGMESQLERLVHELLARDVRVTAIAALCDMPDSDQLDIVRVRGPRGPFLLYFPWFLVAGTISVARNRRGVVYTLGAATLNRADVRKIPFSQLAFERSRHYAPRASRSTMAHRLNARLTAAFGRSMERLLYRPALTKRLVATSTGDALELEAIFGPGMTPVPTIPNGVDCDRFQPDPAARRAVRAAEGLSADDPVAVFVGGDWGRKGLRLVVDALKLAPQWTLLVAGSGDAAAELEYARAAGVGDRLRFFGRVPDVERILAASDVIVNPSAYEPFGNAVLEGMACGLPAIVARANGVSDFVDGHATGRFVERDADAIADALIELEDRELRTRLGTNARM
ncbi:MAG: glycosyltransferase family 4 protein, partial [Actinomycetota bacterium]|nr:glycosyltransferase family 4 protein [Actinomycetota bacterium]